MRCGGTMLRAGDHHVGLYENRDSQNSQITARRSAQPLEKRVIQFERSISCIGNDGKC